MTLARIPVVALTALLAASEAHAWTWCYDRYTNRRYRCLSTGERIAIGVSVGVGVFLLFALCGMARRKRLQNQHKQFRPPPPGGISGMGGMGGNPYANNPPPPVGTYGNYSGYNGGPDGPGGPGGYGGPNNLSNLPPPPNSYQPGGLSGQYYNNERTTATDFKDTPLSANDNELADHSYEYRQAQENASGGAPPPGYSVPSGGYAAPEGPPPGKN